MQDIAEAKAADAEEKRREQQQPDTKPAAQQPAQQQAQQQTTPDYAAGLTPSNPPTPGPPTPSTPLLTASGGGASTLHSKCPPHRITVFICLNILIFEKD